MVWFTGLSGAGKTTLAFALDDALRRKGIHTAVLDGDSLRLGLNSDLGFSPEDRATNVQRTAQVSKLMVDAGLVVIVSLISPQAESRNKARSLFNEDQFFEVYLNTPLEVCEQRDPKGLYRNLMLGDLTKTLDFPDASYDAVISCGTFTHGHVGPECFPELLRITRPGAVFACGTIGPVLDGAGFGSALARLVALGRITPIAWRDIPIYEGADHPHKDDRGLVMVFRTP